MHLNVNSEINLRDSYLFELLSNKNFEHIILAIEKRFKIFACGKLGIQIGSTEISILNTRIISLRFIANW